MPQLDKVTFLSQFFWLSFFYIGFYFIILKFFLPKMSRIFKFRKKKMSGSQEEAIFLVSENEKVRNQFDRIVSKSLNTSRTLFGQNFHLTENWLNRVGYDTNKTHYQAMNKAYIQTIGDNSLIDNLALGQVWATTANPFFTQLLVSKIK